MYSGDNGDFFSLRAQPLHLEETAQNSLGLRCGVEWMIKDPNTGLPNAKYRRLRLLASAIAKPPRYGYAPSGKRGLTYATRAGRV